MTTHGSAKTTKLYDRTSDANTLDEGEGCRSPSLL